MRGAIGVQNKIYASLPRGVFKLCSFRCIFCCNNEDACLLTARRALCLIFLGLRSITVELRDWKKHTNVLSCPEIYSYLYLCLIFCGKNANTVQLKYKPRFFKSWNNMK